MQRKLNRIIIIILTLWLIVFGASPLIVQAAAPAIVFSPTSGPPGNLVTVTGSDFTANSTGFVVTYDGTVVATTPSSPSTNYQGGWSATFIVPLSASGSHYVNATGNLTSANATFIVTPGISTNPSSGVTGTSVTINGYGFGASETGITVIYDGTSVKSGITADTLGSWNSSFVVPASASGARTIDAYGTSSTPTLAASVPDITFNVTPKISANRASAAPGSSVTITGTGFGAGETGVTVKYDDITVYTNPPVNPKGGWTATFVVPPSPAGSHTIGAYGSSTSINSVPNITLTTTAGISISPTSAAPGKSITITGAGFNAGETGITVTYDDKTVGSGITADSNGGWKVNFTVPASPSGSHTIDAGSPTTPATTIADITFTVTPGISASRASAAPGSSVTITGSGFGASETGIVITYDGAPATASIISADATGDWKATLLVPASPAGSHTIGAYGASTKAASVAVLPFSVTPGISTNRPSAAPGSSVTITGSGFGASETGITITYDGTVVQTTPPSPSANAQGSWSASFVVPASTSGSHSISAQGSVTPLTSLSDKGVNIEAGILINPATSYVGATVEVTGSGFAANSPLKFTYDNKDISAASATTDESGSFSKSITIPKSQAGDHTIKVTDEQNHNKSATFTMESDRPPAPALLSPGDSARLGLLGDITPTLKWSGVTDPSGVVYNLQVDTNPDFSHPILEKTDIPGRSYTLTSAETLPRGEYYWRIRAVDGASNQGAWSEVWKLKSGLMPLSALVILIALAVVLVAGLVYFFGLRRPRRYEGVPVPEATEASRPITAQWRLIEPGEGAGGERPLPYRLALPQAPKGEKTLSTEEMARLKVIIDFAQSLPLVEPGYNAKWLLDLAENSMGIEVSAAVYKQLIENELQVRYEPAWMRHPIFQDLAALLEGQPILDDLNAFVDAVNRCASEATLLLQEIYSGAVAEIPTDFLEKGGWEFISAVYSDAMRWYLGKALRDPSERDYVIKPGEEAGAVYLWGEEISSFGGSLIRAQDEKEALQFRVLHLKLRRTYRNSDTVKQLVDIMTQMAVQRDRLSSAFSQFDNFTR